MLRQGALQLLDLRLEARDFLLQIGHGLVVSCALFSNSTRCIRLSLDARPSFLESPALILLESPKFALLTLLTLGCLPQLPDLCSLPFPQLPLHSLEFVSLPLGLHSKFPPRGRARFAVARRRGRLGRGFGLCGSRRRSGGGWRR